MAVGTRRDQSGRSEPQQVFCRPGVSGRHDNVINVRRTSVRMINQPPVDVRLSQPPEGVPVGGSKV